MDDPVQLVWFETINHGFAQVTMNAWFDHKREYGVIDVYLPRKRVYSFHEEPLAYGYRLNCYVVKSGDFRNTISMAQQLWNETDGFLEQAQTFHEAGKNSAGGTLPNAQ